MPVVSDASPLILLARIGKLSLLKELYLEIVIPLQVRNEVTKHDDEASFLILSEIENGWIKSKAKDVEISPEINRIGNNLGLHKGEMYALSLAVNMNLKEFLADDKSARVAARILGLRAIGCLGIVMKAHQMGIITRNDAISSVQKLVKAGLWISPEVLVEVFNSIER
jgi:predicted nucleic acid-binding protein